MNHVPPGRNRGEGMIRTIWISDMAGFTRTTFREGDAAAWDKIVRMRRAAARFAPEYHGRLYKRHADDLYVLFEAPVQALRFTAALFRALPEDIRLSVGIGHGRVRFREEDRDYYGMEVNLASKLGEDIAEPGMVLLTEAAWRALPEEEKAHCSGPFTLSLSGVAIRYYRWRSRRDPCSGGT